MNSQREKSESLAAVPTDESLLSQFIEQKDEAALKQLLEKHATLVMSVCRQVLRNRHDAEEAFQETFVKLIKKADSIRSSGSLSSWLYRVAYRESMAIVRRSAPKTTEPISEEPIMPEQDNPAHEFDELQILHEELNDLEEKYRGPLVLCYLEGKSQKEAARELNVTLASIKASVASGREQLQKRLLRRGVAIGAVLAAWQTSQVSAGTLVTSAVMQKTLTGCLAKSTASVAISKGTSWSALGGGKKLVLKVVAIAFLAGAGLAIEFLIPESENQASTNSVPNENKPDEKGTGDEQALPKLEDILAKQFERSETIHNYELHMKTSYYKNLSIISEEIEDGSESELAPFQSEYFNEIVRWNEPKYYTNRVYPKLGGGYQNLVTSYNGEFTLADVPVSQNNTFSAVYQKGGASKTLWGDANSYPMFFFLNFKLFDEDRIHFNDETFKVRGWGNFNGEKCVVIHTDQEIIKHKGSGTVKVFWFSADAEFRPVKGEYYPHREKGSKSEYGPLLIAWEIKYKDKKHHHLTLPDSWHAEYYRNGKLLSSRTTKEIKYEINKEFKDEDFQINLQKPVQVREYISSNQQIERTLNTDGTLEPIPSPPSVSRSRNKSFFINEDNITYVTLLVTLIVILTVIAIHRIRK